MKLNRVWVIIHNDSNPIFIVRAGPLVHVYQKRKDAECAKKQINRKNWRGYARVVCWTVFNHSLKPGDIR